MILNNNFLNRPLEQHQDLISAQIPNVEKWTMSDRNINSELSTTYWKKPIFTDLQKNASSNSARDNTRETLENKNSLAE